MSLDRIIIDTSAAVDFLRPDRASPPQFHQARQLLLPLFALAELKLGIVCSARRAENLQRLQVFLSNCQILSPDLETTDRYVQIRQSTEKRGPLPANRADREGALNDLWIAALCLQHGLPLLSNDRDFDGIEGLEVPLVALSPSTDGPIIHATLGDVRAGERVPARVEHECDRGHVAVDRDRIEVARERNRALVSRHWRDRRHPLHPLAAARQTH